MAKSNSLGRAKDAKQDEFYTQLADIENELRHYRPHFKGKTVLCNCDDPYESNFFKSGSSWSRSSSGRSGTPCPPRASAWSSSRTSGPRP